MTVRLAPSLTVTPAKEGVHAMAERGAQSIWIPAFAGMTGWGL
jgi:hypothetical protein